MSIRLRLTLLYTVILALTLVAFSVALYLTLARTMSTVVRDTLADEATRLVNERSVDYDVFSKRIMVRIPLSKFTTQNTFIQARTLDGAVVYRTPNLFDIELPLSAKVADAVYADGDAYEYAQVQNERLLIYNKLIDVNRASAGRRQNVGVIQVARSLADQDHALNVLRRNLLVGSSLATLLAFGIGWMLAGAALQPINSITQTAHAIGAERDFSRRVPYSGPLDEVGRLAATINTMLNALQGAYRQEAQALQAQRRFVADASHELRTPLTTIRGNLALLQRQPPISAADRVAVLEDMVDESERMSRLVSDLLVLARADAGRPVRRDLVEVKPLLEDVCRKARALGPGPSIGCTEIADVTVIGDPDALTQVLLILLDNARKFTPSTGRITITAATGGGAVAVSVRDSGSGIAPEALPHIFERFYRGDSSRTGGGAGLGLAIARALVEAQGGTISVTSTVGEGSVFTIELPRPHSAPPPPSQAAAGVGIEQA